jgi:hypothetical protein
MNAVKHYTNQAESFLLLASLAERDLADLDVKYPQGRPAHAANVTLALQRAAELARKEEKSFRAAAKAAEAALSQAV